MYVASKVPREMSLNNLMICRIEPKYTAEYIANVFWRKGIARVSSITLIPQLELEGEVINTAYITLLFCDSKPATDFIYHFNGVRGYMFSHDEPEEDNIWFLEPNTHYYGELCVGEFTTKFTNDFFVSSSETSTQVGDDKNNSKNKFSESHPIRGLNGEYYSITTAVNYIYYKDEQCDWSPENEKLGKFEEVKNFQKQVVKHIGYSKFTSFLNIISNHNIKNNDPEWNFRNYMNVLTDHQYDGDQVIMTDEEFDKLADNYQNYMMLVTRPPWSKRVVANTEEGEEYPPGCCGVKILYVKDDLINFTMPTMEREVAMTDREIEDLLEEQKRKARIIRS